MTFRTRASAQHPQGRAERSLPLRLRQEVQAVLRPGCRFDSYRAHHLFNNLPTTKPARKRSAEVSKKPVLAHTGSKRTAHSAAHLLQVNPSAETRPLLAHLPFRGFCGRGQSTCSRLPNHLQWPFDRGACRLQRTQVGHERHDHCDHKHINKDVHRIRCKVIPEVRQQLGSAAPDARIHLGVLRRSTRASIGCRRAAGAKWCRQAGRTTPTA
jgi:hypothetical protein